MRLVRADMGRVYPVLPGSQPDLPNVEPVVVCCVCGRATPISEMLADLDGPAFHAYYHGGCADKEARMRPVDRLVRDLCRAVGDVPHLAEVSDTDLYDAFVANSQGEDRAALLPAAARGDVDAILRLRRDCGLPDVY